MLPLKRRFRDSQIAIITNFVVVSSVGIKRVDCSIEDILEEPQSQNINRLPMTPRRRANNKDRRYTCHNPHPNKKQGNQLPLSQQGDNIARIDQLNIPISLIHDKTRKISESRFH